MNTVVFSLRLDADIKADCDKEAKRRGQSTNAFLRTLIRDGIAGYDALSEKILQNGEDMEERLRLLEAMVGSLMHLVVEHQVRSSPPGKDETHESYAARLQATYTEKVYGSAEKGLRIRSTFKVPKK